MSRVRGWLLAGTFLLAGVGFTDLSAQDELPDKSTWTAAASSSGDGGGAGAAIDGSTDTFWQTAFTVTGWLRIDLQERQRVQILRYLPRDADHSIKGFRVYVTDNTEAWGDPVAEGELPYQTAATDVSLASKNGRYVILEALGTYLHSAGAREIWLYGDGVAPIFYAEPDLTRLYTETTNTITFAILDPDGAEAVTQADLALNDPSDTIASLRLDQTDVTAGGADLLTFTGTDCDDGPLTIIASTNAGHASIELTEGSSSYGAIARPIEIEVVPRVVRLDGHDAVGVSVGGSASRRIELVDATLTAPGDIPLAIGTPDNANATIAATGEIKIANGERTSVGSVSITGASEGETRVTLTVGNGFIFEETGTASIELHVVILGDVIYVAADGSDTTGTGSPAAPFRTLTHALLFAVGNDAELRVGAGVYGTAAGETFPLNVPVGCAIVGTMGPARSGADSTLIHPGAAARAFNLPPTAAGSSGLLENLVVSNALGSAINAGGWRGTIRNCVIEHVAPATATAALIYSSGTEAVVITLEDTIFRNVTTANQYLMYFWNNSGSIVIDGCTFTNIHVNTTATVSKTGLFRFSNNTSTPTLTIRDTVFDTLSATANFSNREEGGLLNPWLPTTIERCVFRHITGAISVICNNRQSIAIRDSLFHNINVGDWGAVRSFFAALNARNCTFDQVSSVFRFDSGQSASTLHNLSISSSTKLNTGGPDGLFLKHVNIHNTPLSGGYDILRSEAVSSFAPNYVAPYDAGNPAAENYRLKPYSALVDIGNNAVVQGATDLAGNTRILDGDGNGTATVDLGAYESIFGASPSPTFVTPHPVYQLYAGESVTLPVRIDPAAAGAVAAVVSYGTNLTGAASLGFPDGEGPSNLTVTAASPLTVPTGTLSGLTIAEDGTAQDVATGEVGIYLHNKVVTAGLPDRFFVRQGQAVQVVVTLVAAGAVAPVELSIATSSVAGDGSNTAAWTGDATIPVGGSQSTGHLLITGGAGINTVELTVGGGFVFEESGNASRTIEIVGHPGWVYVDSATGDDNAIGTLAAPMRSITHAIAQLSAGDEVRVLAGTYGPTTETYPLQPGGVRIVGYNPDGAPSAEDVVLTGSGTAANLFFYNGPQAGYIANVKLMASTHAAIFADAGTVTVSNALFTGITVASDRTAGIRMRNDSQVTTIDTRFTGLTGRGAVVIEAHIDGYNNNYTALRCDFTGNTSDWGTVAAGTRPVAGRFFLTDCLFQNNSVQNTNTRQDSYSGSAIYIWGTGGYASTIQADRCRFIGNSGGHLIGISNMGTGASLSHIRNCLFAGNISPRGMIAGYNWSMNLSNITATRNTGGYAGRTGGTVNIRNSIIRSDGVLASSVEWGTTAATLRLYNVNIHGTPVGVGYNTSLSVNVTTADPLLRRIPDPFDAALLDAHLRAESPAINAGNNAYATGATDLDGAPRTLYGTVDLGAYEMTLVGTILILR